MECKEVEKQIPDFIGKNETNRIIADAKYKPIRNIHGDDYFQVLAYMMRFDSKKGFYFYPEVGDNTVTKLQLQSGSKYDNNNSKENRESEIFVIKLGIEISKESDDFKTFCLEMKNAETKFMETLKMYI